MVRFVSQANEGISMAKGRHISKRRTRAVIIVAVVAGILVLAVGGAAYAAYRYEQARADTILPGVTVAGIDVGEMTQPEAIAAVRAGAQELLSAPITVKASGKTWTRRVRRAPDQALLRRGREDRVVPGDGRKRRGG